MKDGQYRQLHTAVSNSKKLRLSGSGKPKWFTLGCQLVYTWLLPWCDDDGKIKAETFQVKANIFPYVDLTEQNICDILVALEEVGLLNWYKVEDERYIEILDFRKYNPGRKDRYKPSLYPDCLPNDNQTTTNSQPTANPKSVSVSVSVSLKNELWFNEFWLRYKKKVGKDECINWYKSNVKTEALHLEIMAGIAKWEKTEQWETIKFRKDPIRFLKKKTWEDEPELKHKTVSLVEGAVNK